MVLVGNKTDLARMVPTSTGREMSKQFGCAFYETSAKLNENVSEVSIDCIQKMPSSTVVVSDLHRLRAANPQWPWSAETETDASTRQENLTQRHVDQAAKV